MYDFFFKTKIGYFAILFVLSAILNAIASYLLSFIDGIHFSEVFIASLATSFVASVFFAITKRTKSVF